MSQKHTHAVTYLTDPKDHSSAMGWGTEGKLNSIKGATCLALTNSP